MPETCQSFFQLPHCALDLVPCIVPVIYAELAVVPIVGIVKKAVFMDISSKLYVAKFPTILKMTKLDGINGHGAICTYSCVRWMRETMHICNKLTSSQPIGNGRGSMHLLYYQTS